MRTWIGGLLVAVLLWARPAGAVDVSLGADVSALYFWDQDKVGVGIDVYPGLDAGGGFSAELQLGYDLAHTSQVSAVYPIYVGVRYDFADLIESNDWHPILAAHAGVSIMQIYSAPAPDPAGTTVQASRPSSADGGLGSNVAIGLNYSASNERAAGIVVQQNWAGSGSGVQASWISLGVAGRLLF